MEQECKRLGDAELDIMLAIWRSHAPVSSSSLQEALRGKRDWALPTLLTALSRLVDKGFLACQKAGRGNLYTPLIDRESYQKQEGKTLLARLYGGSFTALAASLYSGGAVSREELASLQRFLEEQGAGHE